MSEVFRFANFAETTLSEELPPGGLSCIVPPGDAGRFPGLASADPSLTVLFALVLSDGIQEPEVAYCTGNVGGELTLERAQEGTTAKRWRVGSLVSHTLTAGTLGSVTAGAGDSADVLDLLMRMSTAEASILEQGTLLVDQGSALATLTTSVDARFDTTNASLTATISALATETSARVTQTTALAASVGTAQADATSALSASATANAAVASLNTTLTAQIAGNTASIVSEASTRATADTAQGTLISALTTNVNGAVASVTAEQTARIAGDATLATSITTVSAGIVFMPNLLPNGDFSDGLGTAAKGDLWEIIDAYGPALGSAYDPSVGSYGQIVGGDQSHRRLAAGPKVPVYALVATYSIGWNGNAAGAHGSEGSFMYLAFYDAANNYLGEGSYAYSEAPDRWETRRSGASIAPPAGTVYCRPIITRAPGQLFMQVSRVKINAGGARNWSDERTTGSLQAQVTTEITARTTADSAIADTVTTAQATASGASATATSALSAAALANNRLSSTYQTRLDAGGAFAGFELMAADGTGTGLISSAKFNVGELIVQTPSGDKQPFVFDTASGFLTVDNLRVNGSLIYPHTVDASTAIINESITYVQIQSGGITQLGAAEWTGSGAVSTSSGSPNSLCTFNITTIGLPVTIMMSLTGTATNNNDHIDFNLYVLLRRSDGLVKTYTVPVEQGQNRPVSIPGGPAGATVFNPNKQTLSLNFPVQDTPPPGYIEYNLAVYCDAGLSAKVTHGAMTALNFNV